MTFILSILGNMIVMLIIAFIVCLPYYIASGIIRVILYRIGIDLLTKKEKIDLGFLKEWEGDYISAEIKREIMGMDNQPKDPCERITNKISKMSDEVNELYSLMQRKGKGKRRTV